MKGTNKYVMNVQVGSPYCDSVYNKKDVKDCLRCPKKIPEGRVVSLCNECLSKTEK